MANPEFIPISFAKNGQKNSIYKTLQPSQYEGALTWDKGAPPITMIYKEDGGLPPDGKDFNGVLFTLSDHAVHRQNGKQILWSQDVVDNFSGYTKDCIIQSDDGTKHFRSLIDNNIYNPNTQAIANRWEVYAGVGSVPVATSTTAGVTKVLNNLVTNDPSSALSAAQGKQLADWLDVVLYSPIPYAGNTAPAGFLPMDGRALTQAQYPKLFALYGSTLPNMADEFIRGKSPSRNSLSRQDDALQNITGTFSGGLGNRSSGAFQRTGDGDSQSGIASPQSVFSFDASRVVRTSTETRPRNIAFLYIVKAG